MGKSVIRGATHLLLSFSLAACATPQKVDPVADYCAAVATALRNCETILAGNSASHECLYAPDRLTEKFEAALNSLPNKTMPRLKLNTLNNSVIVFFMDYIVTSASNGQSRQVVGADGIIKDCNDFAAEVH